MHYRPGTDRPTLLNCMKIKATGIPPLGAIRRIDLRHTLLTKIREKRDIFNDHYWRWNSFIFNKDTYSLSLNKKKIFSKSATAQTTIGQPCIGICFKKLPNSCVQNLKEQCDKMCYPFATLSKSST